MNIAILGNSTYVVSFLEGIKKNIKYKYALINLNKKLQPKNSIDLKKKVKNTEVIFFETNNINSKKTYQFLKKFSVDIIISFWPKIISSQILQLPQFGVLGSHPTKLPLNRGRHPLHWSIILGIKKSSLSFFSMETGVDSGKIVKQLNYKISKSDDILSLENKINKIIKKNSNKVLNLFLKNQKNFKIQDKKKVNYFRKRNFLDLNVNLKMDFSSINKLVKSYTYPYEGSYIIIDKHCLRIKDVKKINNKNIDNVEIGKIIKISKKSLVTRCSDCLININFFKNLSFNKNKIRYIHDPLFYLLKFKSVSNFINMKFLSN